MDPTLIAAILAFVAIGGLGLAFTGGGQPAAASKRVKAVASARNADKRKQTADSAALKRRQSTQEALKELSANEKQSRKRRHSIKGLLAQAGLTATPTTFWIISAVVGLLLAAVGFFIKGPLGAGLGFFIGFLGLPRWVLGMLVSKRQKVFANQLADAIDIIVRGVKSGLPLNQCLRIIAAESPDPIKSEFQALVDGQAMGVPLEVGMQRLYENMPLPEVNFFAIVLVIQQKTGGNLSESLGNLSTVLRQRKLMKEKVKALSAEANASAMIIGALPLIVMTLVYLTRPAYIMILFTDPTGNFVLMCAAIMMGMGIFIMHKMVNFKF
ncbi:type II secretion system F family protein [Vitreimonas sp.]|jgi:tight adherence protein B|uniref:type II secretion system F family protein n=1 Tax=Vitreimonas sp. TaxID=3069702 RepID=UPI002ED9B797